MAIHPQVRVVVKPYGSALPLGFFAFGIGMMLLAANGAQWVKPDDVKTVGILLLSFVFPLEFLAAAIAFLARDTGSATALGLFSTSWLALGLVLFQAKPGILSAAVGYYLLAFTVVVVLLAIASIPGKPLLTAFLLVASLRSAFGAIYELGGGNGWNEAGGWLALALFVGAMYGGLAFLLEDTLGRSVLPLFRAGSSREAIEGDLSSQLQALEGEAGVRQAL